MIGLQVVLGRPEKRQAALAVSGRETAFVLKDSNKCE